MKRWTRSEMLRYLRGRRAVGATSRQMGHDRSWLSRTLSGDPEGAISQELAAQILDACDATQNGVHG